ncbi:MAG: hypothetical protein Q8K57_10850 [Thiobacillus sp.]|nr:hypothetical protein [Thiobacillus sp.]MDP1925267.1 hypothetical protein [Thiobacillus sp.]
MRSFRIFLALLIALALPAQTLADARMAIGCCPMSAMDMQAAMASGHDCCDEHDTNSTGAHCDAGSNCHCGFHLALAIHDFLLPSVRERAHYSSAFPTQPYPAPSTVHWRPPAPRSALT